MKVRIFVTRITPPVRALYRGLRRAGLSRRDANCVVAGLVMGTGEGTVEVREQAS